MTRGMVMKRTMGFVLGCLLTVSVAATVSAQTFHEAADGTEYTTFVIQGVPADPNPAHWVTVAKAIYPTGGTIAWALKITVGPIAAPTVKPFVWIQPARQLTAAELKVVRGYVAASTGVALYRKEIARRQKILTDQLRFGTPATEALLLDGVWFDTILGDQLAIQRYTDFTKLRAAALVDQSATVSTNALFMTMSTTASSQYDCWNDYVMVVTRAVDQYIACLESTRYQYWWYFTLNPPLCDFEYFMRAEGAWSQLLKCNAMGGH